MKKIVSTPAKRVQNLPMNNNTSLPYNIIKENDNSYNTSPINTLFAPLFATPILGYALLFFASKHVVNNIKGLSLNNLNLNSLNLNTDSINSLRNKLDTALKIVPYLPENMISTVNKYIPIYNKLNKMYSLIEFAQNNSSLSEIKSVSNLSKQDKVSNILTVIKEDYPDSAINGISPFIEIFSNMDKYKTVLDGIKNMGNIDNAPEDTIKSIIDIAGPLLGVDVANLGKIKEMVQMFQLLNVVNSPDEE
ncbi:hypothetical protein [Abyssisolibacter fermentans]|uniref:hypothetical protein n=1 Tax=Abyssisolibacter fermentans TaxID=1766203 RepID=UPI00082DCC4F|nr:hypothetical protein [Abyssisolibacter fermentans]